MAWLVAGGCWLGSAAGQDTSGSSGGGAAPATGGSGSGGSSAPSADPGSFLRPATPESGAASSFGTPTSGLPGTDATPSAAPAAAAGASAARASSDQPSFTLPGFYGASPTTFTAGEGRLARPRFRYNVSLAVGYDDNVLSTPEDAGPEQLELVDEGEPPRLEPRFETQLVRTSGGFFVPMQVFVGFREVGGKEPQFRRIPPQEKAGSFVTRAGGRFDIQLFTRRSLLTFDLRAGADYNWNRPGPGKKTDYNGSVAFNYLYRLTPRLQFTAAANAAYLSQPDFSRINTPQDTQGSGDYVSATAKIDLSYRWSPRFTTVLSATDNALFYQEKAEQTSNYNETIVGSELRYLWSPKLTLLLEGRFSQITYAEDPTRNATTSFLLIGGEVRLSNRLSGSIRLGQALRSFDESGDGAITPYLETAVLYRVGPLSTVNWTTRYGFEEPGSANEERQTFRTGLSYTQVFSPRLNGVASINYLDQAVTQTTTDQTTSDKIFDATVRLEYAFTRRFLVNATYSFTDRSTSTGLGDFYRNRLFFGGEYTF